MNWLKDAFDQGFAIQERKHCFISSQERQINYEPDSKPEFETYYTLCDYETGGPVLGEFLNTYGEWDTIEETREAALDAGYECNPDDDEI